MPEIKLTLENHFTQAIVQFGFIIFFSAFFPLGGLIAFLINLLNTLLTAKVFSKAVKRGESLKINSIGIWNSVLSLVSYGSVCFNSYLIFFQKNGLEKLIEETNSENDKLILLLGIAFTLLCMFIVRMLITRETVWTKERLRIEKYYGDEGIESK